MLLFHERVVNIVFHAAERKQFSPCIICMTCCKEKWYHINSKHKNNDLISSWTQSLVVMLDLLLPSNTSMSCLCDVIFPTFNSGLNISSTKILNDLKICGYFFLLTSFVLHQMLPRDFLSCQFQPVNSSDIIRKKICTT